MVTLDGDTAKARTDVLVTQFGHSEQGAAMHYSSVGAFHDDLVRTHRKAGASASGISSSTTVTP